MPFLGNTGGSNITTGRGGFHPGVGPQDTSSSAAAGSMGTSTLGGTGSTIANTTSTTVTASRVTADPFNNGPITYSISSGSLPPGFSLNSSTGQVTGAYTVSGWNSDGQVYNFTVRATDASKGAAGTSDRSYSISVSVPFLYRQIITTGYVLGGYKDSSPWRNVSSMNHSTDTATSHGDQIQSGLSYTGGVNSRNTAFGWSGSNTWPGVTTDTVCFNMRTNTQATHNSNMNMIWARNDCETIFKEHEKAWIIGGGNTNVDVFNLTNETMLSNQGITSIGGNSSEQDGVAAMSTDTKGFAWGGGNTKITFATETWSAGVDGSSNGQQKAINSKVQRGWAGNEGTYNGGNNFRRWNLTTETNLGTTGKPITDSGEENFDMGQDHSYMLGCYTAAGQNSRAYRWNYGTETGFELGASGQPSAVPGRSSGSGAWRD